MTTTSPERPSRPGVYVSEAPLSRIVPLSSGIGTYGCFLGTSVRGPMSPVFISSMSEYYDIFGTFSWKKTLPAALSQYFANGGGPTFVTRVIDGTASATATATATFDDAGATIAVTGVTAGTPGTFAPANATIPANLTVLKNNPAVGDGANAAAAGWNVGQWIVLGDNSEASWNGNSWVVGKAASITGVTAGTPGAFTPANAVLPATLAALQGHSIVGNTGSGKPGAAWTGSQRVVIGDGSSAKWNGTAWVVAAAVMAKSSTKTNETGVPLGLPRNRIKIDAFSPGAWGNLISYAITTRTQVVDTRTIHTFTLDIWEEDRGRKAIVERFSNLSMDTEDPRYFINIVNSATIGSKMVTVFDVTPSVDIGSPLAQGSGTDTVPLVGGDDGDDANINGSDYAEAFDQFVDIEGLLLVNCPKVTDLAALETMIVKRGDSILIQDTAADDDPLIDQSNLPTSSYGTSYYPWIYINDPAPGAARGSIVKVPPGASVAGMIVRTDTLKGVFKAPAGMSAGLVGAVATTRRLSNTELDELAEMHVNAVRSLQGVGTVVMGARTRWFEDVSQFLSVRRTINYVKRRAVEASRFALFEPNTFALWEQLRVANGAFLSQLFVDGGLAGTSPDQAFYVKVDGTNNTAQTMANGELHVEIGIAPVFPAEFVIIRVGQFDGGTTIEEG